jgi:hypothetical protein
MTSPRSPLCVTAVVAAVVVAVTSCGTSEPSGGLSTPTTPATAPATPNTEPAPIATSPTSSPLDSIDWVVGGREMSRGVPGETYSVYCIPADELDLDQTRWTHYRQVQTVKAVSYGAVEGSPCPSGPILMEW